MIVSPLFFLLLHFFVEGGGSVSAVALETNSTSTTVSSSSSAATTTTATTVSAVTAGVTNVPPTTSTHNATTLAPNIASATSMTTTPSGGDPTTTPKAPAVNVHAVTEIIDSDEFPDLDTFADETHTYTINNTKFSIIRDDHDYYSSEFYDASHGGHFWVDLDARNSERVIRHELLSNSHRFASTVPLSFEFPFYGHPLNKVTIAVGGFVHVGEHVHKWLAATQFVAPLMANFDTSLTNDSVVKYSDNGTSITIEWENVTIQENPNDRFSFQVTLHKSGDIVFAYRDVPLNISSINVTNHPVKVGLSDGLILENQVIQMTLRTVYEYHNVSLLLYPIVSGTAIVFRPKTTCNSLTSCLQCVNSDTVKFNCRWCFKTGTCSDGIDRSRQSWLASGCSHSAVSTAAQCSAPPPGPRQPGDAAAGSHHHDHHDDHQPDQHRLQPGVHDGNELSGAVASHVHNGDKSGDVHSSAVGGVLAASVLLLVFGWLLYAYWYPHSTSGQILIRYRPSQWRLRHGEARYTAASIHM